MRALSIISVGLLSIAVIATEPAGAGSSGSAAITGTVKFTKKAPNAKLLDKSSDPECAKTKSYDETVVVGKGGGLKDVHVRIKVGDVAAQSAPTQPVVIEQVGCIYRPRVSGAMKGQEVHVTNGDATLHNVHAYRGAKRRTAFNRAQPAKAKPIMTKKLGKAGTTFELKCDVHKWMEAYVPITDHPFFDVTGDDGKFAIQGVPKGKTYTLEAWHAEYGVKSATVKAGGSVSFEFP